MKIAPLFILFFFCIAVPLGAQTLDKTSSAVQDYLASPSQDEIKIWVYFADHGEADKSDLESMVAGITFEERAYQRRVNRSDGPLADIHDLPVREAYVRQIVEAGCRVKHRSKYLNAVSAYATAGDIRVIQGFEFVRRIDRVQTAHRKRPENISIIETSSPTAPVRPGSDMSPAALTYGPSFGQLDLINVISLHDAGLYGQGILVAILDTGFNRRHESLAHLDVIAEWDFVNNDPVTENEAGDPSWQHNHGTATLSAMGGYAPGTLVGPAWGATYAIGKTEQVDVEIQQEEDDYVRGLEWADSIGAVIVSTSLGYYDWYTYEDMDGNTAVTTIAADIAAARGLLVITAAGNEGPLPWPGLIAPADGDSVVAVGAVDSNGLIWSSSSRGPTFDGRIKPDVCAQGVSVYAAAATGSTSYYYASGTSLATPLVAGAAALCLQMNLDWSPIDLRDALRSSGDHSSSPDNEYGWGVIDAHQAALYGATGVSVAPPAISPAAVLMQSVPNPFIPSVSGQAAIRFRLVGSAMAQGVSAPAAAPDRLETRQVALSIYDVKGRLVRRLFEGAKSAGEHVVEWDGLDDRGIAVSSSVYYYRLSVGGSSVSKKLVLIRR